LFRFFFPLIFAFVHRPDFGAKGRREGYLYLDLFSILCWTGLEKRIEINQSRTE